MLGVGLGMFVDGVLLHQVLQWHGTLSSTDAADDRWAGLDVGLLADGLFHVAALLVTGLGVALLYRAQRLADRRWPWGELVGGLLVGWGASNVVEGLIDHHLFGVHHVREEGPVVWAWDVGFLLLSTALVVIGVVVRRRRGVGWAEARRTGRSPT